MKQKELYSKDIYRHIEGVIKADDTEDLLNEVEEYVITKEVEQNLKRFFEHYIEKKFSSSVWISGEFGSGKSHLLKMLALMLSNTEINEKKCGELIKSKISDFELDANIQKALSIPAGTILFNISQKSDGIGSASRTDPVLAAFMKVFNESQGYLGQLPNIAEIERHLDEDGEYERFRQLFREKNGKEWVDRRPHILFNRKEFARAYAALKNISEEEAVRSFDDQKQHYAADIEGFAKLVKKYIDKQQKGFRLGFFVDEVGQYIAEEGKLMLSLQTIAETLATITGGKAFLVVTSQSDLDATLGDLTAKQKNDFSKIQARFAVKLPLSSSNAGEVIQKRLLEKNENGVTLLKAVYETEKDNFGTLLSFSNETRKFEGIRNEEHFIATFPFMPYQYELLHESMKSLSAHNAFTGKHQSSAARSMLGVFQNAAKRNAEEETGTLVRFPQMFDGMRDILQVKVQEDIFSFERKNPDLLALEVLKTLFMVKYVDKFVSNLNNLTILLLRNLNTDIAGFRKQVQTALNMLEHELYIRRVGENYEYLTHREKDIELEIQNTEIDRNEERTFLSEMIFTELLKDSKVKLDSDQQVYEFGKKIDNSLIGKERDFYVHIITPANGNGITPDTIAMRSINSTDLLVYLDATDLIREVVLFKKTDNYIRKNMGNKQEPELESIIVKKASQNTKRKRAIIDMLKVQLATAKLYETGREMLPTGSSDPKTHITNGLQQLLRTIYPNLSMLGGEYTESSIRTILNNQTLFPDPNEAEREILMRLERDRVQHQQSTVKTLLDNFSGRPYGWYLWGLLANLASLFVRNKIGFTLEGRRLEKTDVEATLTNSRIADKIVVFPESEISPAKVTKLRHFHQEYFTTPNDGNDPREISRIFKEHLKQEIEELKLLHAQKGKYSFLSALENEIAFLTDLAEKEYPYYYDGLPVFEEPMIHRKERVIEPLRQFMKGQQRTTYDTIVSYIEKQKPNLSYVSGAVGTEALNLHEHLEPYKSEVLRIARVSYDTIRQSIVEKLIQERSDAIAACNKCRESVEQLPDYLAADETSRKAATSPFDDIILKIEKEEYFGNIRTLRQDAEGRVMLNALARLEPKEQVTGSEPHQPKTFIQSGAIPIMFDKKVLETEDDVHDYISKLKEAYLEVIREDKRVML